MLTSNYLQRILSPELIWFTLGLGLGLDGPQVFEVLQWMLDSWVNWGQGLGLGSGHGLGQGLGLVRLTRGSGRTSVFNFTIWTWFSSAVSCRTWCGQRPWRQRIHVGLRFCSLGWTRSCSDPILSSDLCRIVIPEPDPVPDNPSRASTPSSGRTQEITSLSWGGLWRQVLMVFEGLKQSIMGIWFWSLGPVRVLRHVDLQFCLWWRMWAGCKQFPVVFSPQTCPQTISTSTSEVSFTSWTSFVLFSASFLFLFDFRKRTKTRDWFRVWVQ